MGTGARTGTDKGKGTGATGVKIREKGTGRTGDLTSLEGAGGGKEGDWDSVDSAAGAMLPLRASTRSSDALGGSSTVDCSFEAVSTSLVCCLRRVVRGWGTVGRERW